MSDSKFDNLWTLMSEHKFEMAGEVAEDVHCTLCSHLLIDPYKSLCGCRYCGACIKEYLSGAIRRCPGYGEQCSRTFLNSEENVEKDCEIYYRLSRLSVKCPFGLCSKNIELIKMEKHLKKCDVRLFMSTEGESSLEDIVNNENYETIHPQLWIRVLRNLKEKITKLRGEVEENKSIISQQDQLIEGLKDLSSKNNDEVKNLTDLIEMSHSETERQKGKIKKLKHDWKYGKSYDEELENQRIEIDKLKKKLKKHKVEIKQLREEFHLKEMKMRDELDELKRNAEENLDESERSLRDNISSIERSIKLLEEKDKAIETETDLMKEEWKKKVMQIKAELEVVEYDVDGVKNDVDKMITEVDCQNNEITSYGEGNPKRRRIESIGSGISWEIRKLILNSAHDFIWTIDKFSDRTGWYDSDSFYRDNYKLSLHMVFGADGRLSLYTNIMKGNYDDLAKWPMKRTIVLSLINQETLKVHVRRRYNRSTFGDDSKFDKPTGINFGIGGFFTLSDDITDVKGVLIEDSFLVGCSLTNDIF